MKKFLAFLAVLLLAVPVIVAQDATSTTTCPSQAETDAAIAKCKEAGLDAKTSTDARQCTVVECVEPEHACPTADENERHAAKCKDEGLESYEYKGSDGCAYIACDAVGAPTGCPDEAFLREAAEKCEARHLDYEYTRDEDDCLLVQCKTPKCPPASEVDAAVAACKEKGGTPATYKDDLGCARVKCAERACPPPSLPLCVEGYDLVKEKDARGCEIANCVPRNKDCPEQASMERLVAKCKELGKTPETRTDEKGCLHASCPEEPGVPCKKEVTDAGCIVVHCRDGFAYDSCAHDCPKEEKDDGCKVERTDDGCIRKFCPDGTEKKHCPGLEGCKTSKDEEGCEVIACDGRTARHCPQRAEGDGLECKTTVDDEQCETTTCTNGFEARICPGQEPGFFGRFFRRLFGG